MAARNAAERAAGKGVDGAASWLEDRVKYVNQNRKRETCFVDGRTTAKGKDG